MPADVARLDLRMRRRSTLAYALGVGVYALLIVALYPTFENDASLDSLSSSNPTLAALFGAAGSLTSPGGWMNANLYANFLPLFALLMTIGYGAAAIAGQDEEGTLGNVASLPTSRRRIVLEKILAIGVLSIPVPAVTLVAALVGRGFDVHLRSWTLVQVTVTSSLMAFDFGLLALLVGVVTASRGTALGVSAAIRRGGVRHQLARACGALDPRGPLRLADLLGRRRQPAPGRCHLSSGAAPGADRNARRVARPAQLRAARHPLTRLEGAHEPHARLRTVALDVVDVLHRPGAGSRAGSWCARCWRRRTSRAGGSQVRGRPSARGESACSSGDASCSGQRWPRLSVPMRCRCSGCTWCST